jgi:hypothetical protein
MTDGIAVRVATRRSIPRGRRRRDLVVVAMLALTATRCTKPPASREVADRFMDIYYSRMNVAEAVELCSGAARTKLEGELRAMQGVPPDAPSGEPRVRFSLTASTNPTPTEATYTYRVTARTSDVGKVVATLGLTSAGGRWIVTSFSESEGPPTS